MDKDCGVEQMKADKYLYWQSRPVYERMKAVSEMTLAAYLVNGVTPSQLRIEKVLVCLERPPKA